MDQKHYSLLVKYLFLQQLKNCDDNFFFFEKKEEKKEEKMEDKDFSNIVKDQFLKEYRVIEMVNGKNCLFKRLDEIEREDNGIESENEENKFEFFPIIFDNHNILDFSERKLTKKRLNLLYDEKYGFNSLFENIIRSCYIKDTILNNKEIFDITTSKEIIEKGEESEIVLFRDKNTKVPLTIGKFITNYDPIDSNKQQIEFEINHELLVGLELINKCKYLLPNYPQTYGFDNCNIVKKRGEKKYCKFSESNGLAKEPVIFSEYIDNSTTFTIFISENKEIKESIQPIFLQIFNALNILHMMNGCYTHYDLHTNNILIKTLKEEIFIPIYLFDSSETLVEIKYLKTKYIAYIIDFASSTFLSFEAIKNQSVKINKEKIVEESEDLENVRKSFIFGIPKYAIQAEDFFGTSEKIIYDYKDENHSYDIYKILAFSFYFFGRRLIGEDDWLDQYNFGNEKYEIFGFFGKLQKYLYDSEESLPKIIDDFLKNSEEERLNAFKYPNNIKMNRKYSDVMKYLISNNLILENNFELYSDIDIDSDQFLRTIQISNIVNKNVINIFSEKFKDKYDNVSYSDKFIKVDFYMLKKFFIERKSIINSMIIDLFAETNPK